MNPMILVVDIGNTNIHLGLFTRGVLRATWDLSTDVRRTVDEYAFLLSGLLGPDLNIEGAIFSSVVPRLTPTIFGAIKKSTHVEPMQLDANTETGIVNGYLNPYEVGMDRLAAAAGGYYFFGAPLLVLDYGTAITLEFVDEPIKPGGKPVYRGGVIMPGIKLAAEALAQGTAQLPPIDITEPGRLIGKTTVESIQSGLINGYLGAVESLVEKAQEEIGKACRVVSTGGDAVRLHKFMPYIHAVEPDLTLFGLRQIYGINNNCPLPEIQHDSDTHEV